MCAFNSRAVHTGDTTKAYGTTHVPRAYLCVFEKFRAALGGPGNEMVNPGCNACRVLRVL